MEYTMNFKSISRCLILLLSSLLGSLAAITTFSSQTDIIPSIFGFYRVILSQKYPLFIFMFIVLFCLGIRRKQLNQKSTLLFELCCVIIAAIWLLGRCFQVDSTLDCLRTTSMQKERSILYFLGSFFLLRESGLAATRALHSEKDFRIKHSSFYDFFERHTFLCFFLLILIFALPSWISCFPGYMCSDAYCQLAYYFGIYNFVSHHPPVNTLLISYCVRLGMLLGSSNAGLYLYICLQYLCYISVFAYTLSLMHRLHTPRWLTLLSLFVVLLCPCFLSFADLVLKDNLYAYAVVLFMAEIVHLRVMGWAYLRKPRHIVLFSLAVAGIMLMRNNGKYMLALFFPILLLVYFFTARKEKTLRSFAGLALILVLPIAASVVLDKIVVARYDIAPGSRREALSLPFQQTARYAFEYGDEVTDEERETINTVLEYENLAWDYYPLCSDPVKCYYVDSSGNAELLNYFKVWLSQGLKHPETYFRATMNQNYPMFCPFSFDRQWYNRTESSNHIHISEPLGLRDYEFGNNVQTLLSRYDTVFNSIPLIRLFSSSAFYTLLTLLLCIFALHERNRNFLLVSLPGLIHLLIVFAAPLVETRYMFPVMYTMPIVTAYYIYSRKKA